MKRIARSVKAAEALEATLHKVASNGEENENLVKLIHQEAFDQLAEKFPNLLRYIVGIEKVKKIDDSTILSVAVVSNGDVKLSIPVVYQNGKVDAVSYIYDPDSDIMLGLTKKIVKLFLEKRSALGGKMEDKALPRLDEGDIRQLFVPPKTWSPKVASYGAFEQLLEKSAEFRYSVAKKIYEDDAYAYLVKKAYDSVPHIIGDEATLAYLERNVGDKVITSYSEIEPWMDKEAAVTELRRFGFVIVQAHPPRKSLVEIEDDTPRSVFVHGAPKEVIRKPGCYLVRDEKTGDVKPIIVFKRYMKESPIDQFAIPDLDSSVEHEAVSSVMGVADPKCIAKAKLVPVTRLLAGCPDNAYLVVRTRTGALELVGAIDREYVSVDDCGEELRIDIPRAPVVVKLNGYSGKPMKVSAGKVIVAGPNDVFVYLAGNIIPETVSSVIENSVSDNKIELISDGIQYSLNGKAYMSAADVAQAMLQKGYDRQSIYALIKTAQDNGSAVMTEVNAKLDTVIRGLVAIAQKVSDLEQRLDSVHVDTDGDAQMQDDTPVSQEVVREPHQDVSAFSLREPETVQQADEPKSAPQVQADDQRIELVQGMNPGVDPAIVEKLLSLKDSGVVDTSLIALALDASNAGEVVREYLGDLLSGTSALARITFNLQLHGNDVSEALGDSRYRQMISSLKGLVAQLTDTYVDIALHANQFSGQE